MSSGAAAELPHRTNNLESLGFSVTVHKNGLINQKQFGVGIKNTLSFSYVL